MSIYDQLNVHPVMRMILDYDMKIPQTIKPINIDKIPEFLKSIDQLNYYYETHPQINYGIILEFICDAFGFSIGLSENPLIRNKFYFNYVSDYILLFLNDQDFKYALLKPGNHNEVVLMNEKITLRSSMHNDIKMWFIADEQMKIFSIICEHFAINDEYIYEMVENPENPENPYKNIIEFYSKMIGFKMCKDFNIDKILLRF